MPRETLGLRSVVANDALRARPDQTPENTRLTVWEKRVRSMTPEQMSKADFWTRKDVLDYHARWGTSPGGERVAAAQVTARREKN